MEEEKKKLTIISKSPLRRLKSEIPGLLDIKRRANSIIPKKPMFTNMMKS